ncbi:MAG: transcription elongation factor GreB [Betaproteobacteria bacterium]|nr:transcription elongation factor GreB [Betaproteobacteria bacterium]NBT83633.1 transcription elongation factor GreB [Betaproteobacteria bacterium]
MSRVTVSTTPNYLTPQGYAALTNERNQLLKVERPKTVEIVSWAASNGDRSENGDYIYGKRRLREIDRRLRFLSKRLELAKIVDSSAQMTQDQVFFGATVTLVDQEGHEQTLRIVGVDETHLGPNYISWVSPIARALIKSREGDSVTFESPSGIRTVEIIRVTYAG